MTENKQFKNRLLEKLYSTNDFEIVQTLNIARDKGGCYLIPAIVNIIKNNKNDEIKNKAITFLNDIKDKNAVDAFVEAIEDEDNKSCLDILVQACWQNGLDFGKHLPVFVRIAVKEKYNTAFDALTVIEQMKPENFQTDIEKQIEFVKYSLTEAKRDKKLLLVELINVLKNRL